MSLDLLFWCSFAIETYSWEKPLHDLQILQSLYPFYLSVLITAILETHLCGPCCQEWYHNTTPEKQMWAYIQDMHNITDISSMNPGSLQYSHTFTWACSYMFAAHWSKKGTWFCLLCVPGRSDGWSCCLSLQYDSRKGKSNCICVAMALFSVCLDLI